jgi:hypothetical protein
MRKACKVLSRYEKLLQQLTKQIALTYPKTHVGEMLLDFGRRLTRLEVIQRR